MMKQVVTILICAFLLRGGIAYGFQNLSDTLSLDAFITTNNIKADKTREGIYINLTEEGKGASPRFGDYLKIKYVGKLLTGKVFDQSVKEEPFVFQLGFRQVIPGWDIVFSKFKIGTKATIYVPADYAYGAVGIGELVPPNTPLQFDVELISVMSRQEYDNYMRSLEDKDRRTFEKRVKEQFELDKKKINEYAVNHKIKTQRTKNGTSYVVTKPGRGGNIQNGDEVTVAFEGVLLDNKVFDSTKDRDPFVFTMGEGKVIEGWEDGLKYFNKGSEGYLMIPSQLAYGATPLEDDHIKIPAYSVLIFKIQIVDVKPKLANN
jgi:FKBP-type peptidyl-prolyl cis-trans isomerase FkpA